MSVTSVVPASSTLSRPLQLTLTRKKLRRIWVMVVAVQLLYAIQLATMADMYIQTKWGSTIPFLTFLVDTFLVSRERQYVIRYAAVIGVTYVVLSSCFLGLFLRMLWRSIRYRKLSFGGFMSLSSSPPHLRRGFSGRIHDIGIRYGIRGERFEEGLVIREGFEITLQILQAYATSQTINTKFVNQSFSVLIALSAVSHPILSRLYAGQVAKKRFACVLVEFFLDIMWGSILPLCVFVKYWHVDRTLTVEQIFGVFEFGFYEKAQREIRQLVILSWWQYLLASFPVVSALINLRSMLRLLSTVRIIESDQATSSPSMALVGYPPAILTKSTREILVALSSDPRKSSFVHWGHRAITIGGIAVCISAIAATSLFESTGRISDASCIHRLYPWFVTDDACVVIFLNCIELQIAGRKEEMDSVLSTIDLPSIGFMGFCNCPALDIPSDLSQSTTLGALLFQNTTILTWPTELAFTTDNFPALHSFGLSNVSLASPPPDALVANELWPETLERVHFYGTDIDELAHEMSTHWQSITSWICINCGLTTFSLAFFNMPRLERWAVWNSTITTIPTHTVSTSSAIWPSLRVMVWTNNPLLTSVGDDVWYTATMGIVRVMSFAFTDLGYIPARWLDQLTSFSLLGYESPLCTTKAAIFERSVAALNCTAFHVTDFELLYQ
ncbi:hypothetical protein Poli38472_001365 [Pythium oligandrum]|uniref:Uncharacterized protein n=1 Tax=Pythium oligandrum TaxID=41045 RepID=A0A8K1FQA3_PYTOL|nr:hypothetical protein Poli38472_001365 [Pythium oligandrum]|eukprot:TMW69209.1 hypothetical protein Poli38472_001365 [Pythium oligandrum]